MSDNQELELAGIKKKLKELLVTNLYLDDITPEAIKDNEPLFGEGLGLDSLDTVEIVVILQRNFGLEFKEMERGEEVFYSVNTLSRYIRENADSAKIKEALSQT